MRSYSDQIYTMMNLEWLWEFEGEKPVRGKNRVVLREVFLALRHRVSGGAGPWKAHRYFKGDMEHLNQ